MKFLELFFVENISVSTLISFCPVWVSHLCSPVVFLMKLDEEKHLKV